MSKRNLVIEIPNKIESSVLIKKGIVLTEANIGGQKKNFLIDSGAPNLILNSNHQSKNTRQKEKKIFEGVSGKGESTRILINEFSWKGMSIKNEETIAIDLSHLENELKIPFYGIIGFRELSYFSFCIDYRAKKMTLWRDFNKDDFIITGEIPFTLHNHIPIISATIRNQELKLGLDTGASMNLFDVKKVNIHSKNRKKDKLHGADKRVQTVEVAVIDSMVINDITFNKMKATWSNIDHLKAAFGELDGLLGYEFLKKRKMVINFYDKMIYLIRERRITHAKRHASSGIF